MKVPTRGLKLFTKSHDIRLLSLCKTPFLMSPECSCAPDTRLNFIHNEQDTVAFGDIAETAEKGSRRMVVATFRLDRLDDDSGNR